ncbi:hypothetical protein LP7551_02654 [Roseibium album]|nr:hypothetical protein LP7551_02654 [Roseibium album]
MPASKPLPREGYSYLTASCKRDLNLLPAGSDANAGHEAEP